MRLPDAKQRLANLREMSKRWAALRAEAEKTKAQRG
jgi:uncharacterized small protein (DUF1192 family)